ncbi:hypothetical protein BT96DRAFT_999499 [Gymnopus androsaceus JB14]|uniref:Uncharacterized protein n=1 Tax=Gymnopus androsaceus JB14 TaxID=1447944 RepID=A0A6A4H6Q1_9AGAR|nr:hypothetical protein BT96DRAFT_999499 [Gymnopus androsaceus JB14]
MPLFRCENIVRAALEVVVEDFLERVMNSGHNFRITAVLTTGRNHLPHSPPEYDGEIIERCWNTQQVCCKSVVPGDFKKAYRGFLQQLPPSDDDITITAILTTV